MDIYDLQECLAIALPFSLPEHFLVKSAKKIEDSKQLFACVKAVPQYAHYMFNAYGNDITDEYELAAHMLANPVSAKQLMEQHEDKILKIKHLSVCIAAAPQLTQYLLEKHEKMIVDEQSFQCIVKVLPQQYVDAFFLKNLHLLTAKSVGTCMKFAPHFASCLIDRPGMSTKSSAFLMEVENTGEWAELLLEKYAASTDGVWSWFCVRDALRSLSYDVGAMERLFKNITFHDGWGGFEGVLGLTSYISSLVPYINKLELSNLLWRSTGLCLFESVKILDSDMLTQEDYMLLLSEDSQKGVKERELTLDDVEAITRIYIGSNELEKLQAIIEKATSKDFQAITSIEINVPSDADCLSDEVKDVLLTLIKKCPSLSVLQLPEELSRYLNHAGLVFSNEMLVMEVGKFGSKVLSSKPAQEQKQLVTGSEKNAVYQNVGLLTVSVGEQGSVNMLPQISEATQERFVASPEKNTLYRNSGRTRSDIGTEDSDRKARFTMEAVGKWMNPVSGVELPRLREGVFQYDISEFKKAKLVYMEPMMEDLQLLETKPVTPLKIRSWSSQSAAKGFCFELSKTLKKRRTC